MKTPNTQLMKQAADALSGRWTLAICTFFVYSLIAASSSGLERIAPQNLYYAWMAVVYICLAGPLFLGVTTFSLAIARKEEAKFCMLFSGFKQNYWKSVGLYIVMILLTFLGLLFFIIPGFIVIAMIWQSFFILRDNPQIGVWQAIKQSRKMMIGFKAKYIGLVLMFAGLILLCFAPLLLAFAGIPLMLFVGIPIMIIGILLLMPYLQVTLAKFYEDVKAHNTDMA